MFGKVVAVRIIVHAGEGIFRMRITLTVSGGPFKGCVFSFDGHDTFLVGRSKRAHFALPTKDRYCSRYHFLVEVNPPHCRLLDLARIIHALGNNDVSNNARRWIITICVDRS